MSTVPTPPSPDTVLARVRAWLPVVMTALALAGWGFAVYGWLKGGAVGPPPIPPVVDNGQPNASADAPIPHAYGWVRDDDAVKAVEATLPFKAFQATPAGADPTPLPKAVYQWQIHQKVTGKLPPLKDQNPVGSCVGFGDTTAIERALVCAIAAGQPFAFTHFVEEATYGGSRNEARPPGARPLRGDGSNGGWAIRWNMDFGMLPRGVYDAGGRHYDLTAYDPNRAREWGSTGVPDALEPECAKFKVGDAVRLRTTAELQRGLANGCGAFTCSILGFTAQRDANGCCRQSGQWGHCMCVDGYHTDEQGQVWFHFENSWDSIYHKGPVGWGNPTGAGFWTDARTVQRMIDEGDSWLVSAVKGFPKQIADLDWFVHLPQPRRDVRAAETVFALAP